MSNLVAVVMAALIVFAFILVYVNRASSEVVGAALPVAFAAFSALALVFAFGNPPAVERSFPVVFVFQQGDKYPIVIPDRPFPSLTLALFDRAVQVNPKLLQDSRFADRSGGPLFHHFLQKTLVDWLASNYFNSWRVRVERFEVGGEQSQTSPAPDAKEFATKKLSAEDLKRALRTNAFATTPALGPGTLVLPPNTSLVVQEPHDDAQQGEVSDIWLKNRLCEVRIQTSFSMSGMGLGAYQLVVPISEEQATHDYYTVQFIVRIDATFQKLLKGHPAMAAHREWVDGIVEGLSHAFDEESIWRRTKEAYLFRQHVAEPARNQSRPMGPIRVTSSPRQ